MIKNIVELRKNVGPTKLHRLANYKQRRQIADSLLGNDLKENEISYLIHVHNLLKQIDVLLKILEEIGGILLKNNVGSNGILFKKQKRNLIHPWTI
jgi:hypothetical protein